MSPNTTVLITGANRGIGKGLLAKYLSDPSTTAIAAVRNPTDANTSSLASLPTGPGSQLIVVKIDSSSETDALAAVQHLKSAHGITHLDLVVANAGVAKYYGPADTTPIREVREHFDINALGPLILFQAVKPLLEAAREAKLVFVSTAAGSITHMPEFPLQNAAYGASKAALDFVSRKIAMENPGFVTFAISPGWVQTEMGTYGATQHGVAEAPTTIEDSVNGLVAKINKATKDDSNSLQSFDGAVYAW